MLELRGELRDALHLMVPIAGRPLHAVYTAADDGEFADVENVLLYNVGASATRHLVSTGVRFERAFALPPLAPSGQQFAHHHDYQLGGPATGFAHWQMRESLASFAGVRLGRADKPEHVWAAIRAQATPPAFDHAHLARFAVRLVLRPGVGGPTNSLGGLGKPVLDGAISALHGHDDLGRLDVVSERLSANSPETAQNLRAALSDNQWAVLGFRRLVRPFGARGVQWNPADDLCVAAEIMMGAADPRCPGRWSLSGEISAV